MAITQKLRVFVNEDNKGNLQKMLHTNINKEKNIGIELLRLVSMIMIVILH